MKHTLYFNIRPKPAPRPRFSKTGTYNTKEYTSYKKAIAHIAKTKYKLQPSDKAISLKIEFLYIKPKSWSKKKKETTQYHIVKPDVDNLVKAVKDALNGIAYKDDAQVVKIEAQKRYSDAEAVLVEIEDM